MIQERIHLSNSLNELYQMLKKKSLKNKPNSTHFKARCWFCASHTFHLCLHFKSLAQIEQNPPFRVWQIMLPEIGEIGQVNGKGQVLWYFRSGVG